jgi:transposase-like protein
MCRQVSQEHDGAMDTQAQQCTANGPDSEVARLQQELRRINTERDILRMALGNFASTISV